MRIADNVEMLQIEAHGTHHPVLTWDDDDVVLIDTSYPGELAALGAEVARCGFALEQITKVILTHQDVDHIGNARILRGYGAQVLAGEHDVAFIQGDQPLTKLTDMAGELDMTPERRAFYEVFATAAPQVVTEVDVALVDGQLLDLVGGIEVVFTPGHTPGHIVLRLVRHDIVVCGDAANIIGGQLVGSFPELTHDQAQADTSLERIKELAAGTYLTYHQGCWRA